MQTMQRPQHAAIPDAPSTAGPGGHGAHEQDRHTGPCAHESLHMPDAAPEAEQHGASGGTGHVLTIRMCSGLSGDMFLAGLLRLTDMNEDELDRRLSAIMPELAGTVRLVRREVHHIGGWHAEVRLPHEHRHRTLEDITALIARSGMDGRARELAVRTFARLAGAEAAVHGVAPEDVRFHEVGALDSILDICLTCELFTVLGLPRLLASPLPLADGEVRCAHGVIPVPAPAVLEMLAGLPVRPFAGRGETVTPTAVALLLSLGAEFGPWPAMRVERSALVYGTTVFPGAANGAVFALGTEDGAASGAKHRKILHPVL